MPQDRLAFQGYVASGGSPDCGRHASHGRFLVWGCTFKDVSLLSREDVDACEVLPERDEVPCKKLCDGEPHDVCELGPLGEETYHLCERHAADGHVAKVLVGV